MEYGPVVLAEASLEPTKMVATRHMSGGHLASAHSPADFKDHPGWPKVAIPPD